MQYACEFLLPPPPPYSTQIHQDPPLSGTALRVLGTKQGIMFSLCTDRLTHSVLGTDAGRELRRQRCVKGSALEG